MTESFWSFVIVSGSGFLLALIKMMYKSKCSQIDLCCIKITRNVEVEAREDEIEMQRNNNQQP